MKKLMTFLCVATGLATLTYCGANAGEPITATKTGVGPVQLGAQASELPATYKGLYDAIKTETIQEEEMGDVYAYDVLNFMLGRKLVMTATPYDGKIGSIEVFASNVKTEEGAYPGMTIAELFGLGAKTEMYNDGTLYFILGGIFLKDDGKLTASGDKKLGDGYMYGTNPEMTSGDFESDAKVKSIVYF